MRYATNKPRRNNLKIRYLSPKFPTNCYFCGGKLNKKYINLRTPYYKNGEEFLEQKSICSSCNKELIKLNV